MRKVLDTNILLDNYNVIKGMIKEGHTPVIAFEVAEELDKMKSRREGELAAKARAAIRAIEEHEIHIQFTGDKRPDWKAVLDRMDLDENYADNKILMSQPLTSGVPLVTNDIAMRIKARAMGITVDAALNEKEIAPWVHNIKLDQFQLMSFKSNGHLDLRDLPDVEKLTPNSLIIMDSPAGRVLGRYREHDKRIGRLIHRDTKVCGIQQMNKEQHFLIDVLLDKSISFVTVSGAYGTGKTLLALASALAQVEEGIFDSVYIAKSMAMFDRTNEIGFTKGTEFDKLVVWLDNFSSNLEFIEKTKYKSIGNNTIDGRQVLEKRVGDGDITLADVSKIRGSSLHKKIIIIDEAQDMSDKDALQIITRIAEGSKVIMVGDISQKASRGTSGMKMLRDALTESPYSAHVELSSVLRSKAVHDFLSRLGGM